MPRGDADKEGFTYYGYMNITFSLDEKLVKEVRKIAMKQGTTLTGLVRNYLRKLAAENVKRDGQKHQLKALERTFKTIKVNIGNRTWKREDLYDR